MNKEEMYEIFTHPTSGIEYIRDNHEDWNLMVSELTTPEKIEHRGYNIVSITGQPPYRSRTFNNIGIMFEDTDTFEKIWFHLSDWTWGEVMINVFGLPSEEVEIMYEKIFNRKFKRN